jgi:membrane-associated protease RseP (regulator of RpoE activity)
MGSPDTWSSLLQVAGASLGQLPQLLNPLVGYFFWLVVLFVYWQARRAARLEEAIYGRPINPPLRRTVSAMGYGLVAGIAGTLLITLLGIPLGATDIAYVWPLALLLLLVDPRLLCFAYAGSALILANLIFGWPPVHAAGLLGLVAVLHLVEGVLVALDPEKIVTPLYVRTRDHGTVGGFFVQRFWPVPLVIVLFLPGVQAAPVAGNIPTPAWWPLISPVAGALASSSLFVLLPIAAGLGYADIALTRPAVRKSAATALLLLLYAAVLLLLAVLGGHARAWLWLGALFAAGAHEWLARHGGGSEVRGVPYLSKPERGVRILDVLPDSPAERLGLRSGQVIEAVNGTPVSDRAALADAVAAASFFLAMDVDGREVEWNRHRGGLGDLGVIPVPEPTDPAHADLTRRRPALAIVGWLQRLRLRRMRP